MSALNRRNALQTAAAMTVGAAVGTVTTGCAAPGPGAKTPFNVPETYVPVVGSDMMFPVRRIYCIGRNYRAHAIEMGSNPDRDRKSTRLNSSHRP